jgi:hypothetical protein
VAGSHPQAGGVLQPVLTTSQLLVGQNQLAFRLLLDHATFVTDADTVVRVYALDDQHLHLRTEGRAFYQVLDIGNQGSRFSLHADRTSPGPREERETAGVYVAPVLFDKPGLWVIEVLVAQDDGPVAVSRFIVEVRAMPRSPMLGVPTSQSRH